MSRSALGLEGRGVVRVLLHCIESWMGAPLSSLQMLEFGYTYSSDFRTYMKSRKECEGEYGDYVGAHGKVKGGMIGAIDGLAELGGEDLRGRVELRKKVNRINYEGKLTKVETEDGGTYTASVCVCTAPLGVMKARSIDFSPPLPEWKAEAINRVGVGSYKKVTMEFGGIGWDREPEVFLCARITLPGKVKAERERVEASGKLWVGDRLLVYNSWAREGLPILEAVLTGEAGEACEGREDKEILEAVLMVMRGTIGRERLGEVLRFKITRWEEVRRGLEVIVFMWIFKRHKTSLLPCLLGLPPHTAG